MDHNGLLLIASWEGIISWPNWFLRMDICLQKTGKNVGSSKTFQTQMTNSVFHNKLVKLTNTFQKQLNAHCQIRQNKGPDLKFKMTVRAQPNIWLCKRPLKS
jgi:hypothetical protein